MCMRKFSSRTGLLDHLYKASDICLFNLELSYPDKSLGEVAAADALHTKEEMARRARGESGDHASVIARQAFGPLQSFLVPIGHRRQSRYPLFLKALKCRRMVRNVDFVVVRKLLSGEAVDEDDIQLDVLASAVRQQAGLGISRE